MLDKKLVILLQIILIVFCFCVGFFDEVFLGIFKGYALAINGIILARTIFILFACFLLQKLLYFFIQK